MISYVKAIEAIRFESSYSRLPLILELRPYMRESVWFRLLGEEWSGCDNIGVHGREIRRAVGAKANIKQMMTASERRKLEAMPEKVTVYRGCGNRNLRGLSWSTDRAIAEKFPKMMRYHAPDPILATAEVFKRDIVAFKTGRNESEIITLKPRLIRLEALEVAA
jgi:hypothetical protein